MQTVKGSLLRTEVPSFDILATIAPVSPFPVFSDQWNSTHELDAQAQEPVDMLIRREIVERSGNAQTPS